ncbi:hypothetical protein M569_03520, partial [Genlisea aurea]
DVVKSTEEKKELSARRKQNQQQEVRYPYLHSLSAFRDSVLAPSSLKLSPGPNAAHDLPDEDLLIPRHAEKSEPARNMYTLVCSITPHCCYRNIPRAECMIEDDHGVSVGMCDAVAGNRTAFRGSTRSALACGGASPPGFATRVPEPAASFSPSFGLSRASAPTLTFVTVPPTETCSISSFAGSSAAFSVVSGSPTVGAAGFLEVAAFPPVRNAARKRRSLSGSACRASAICRVSPVCGEKLNVLALEMLRRGEKWT